MYYLMLYLIIYLVNIPIEFMHSFNLFNDQKTYCRYHIIDLSLNNNCGSYHLIFDKYIISTGNNNC